MLAFTSSFGRRLIHCLCLSSFRVIKHALDTFSSFRLPWLPCTRNIPLSRGNATTYLLVTVDTEYPRQGNHHASLVPCKYPPTGNLSHTLVTLHMEYPPSGESNTHFGYPGHGISPFTGINHALHWESKHPLCYPDTEIPPSRESNHAHGYRVHEIPYYQNAITCFPIISVTL